IACHETRIPQRFAQRLIVLDQRAGQTVTNRTRLTSDPTAPNRNADVELVLHADRFERLAHDHPRRLTAEELIQRAVVHENITLARTQENASGGSLAATGTVV